MDLNPLSRTLSGTLLCGVRTFLCLATATVRSGCQLVHYSAGNSPDRHTDGVVATFNQLPIANAIFPATKKKAAAASRTCPETATPEYFFRSQAVAGQAEMPESSAYQPLVSGHGPFVQSSHRPPPAAAMVHVQATIHPRAAAKVVGPMVFCLVFASFDNIGYALGPPAAGLADTESRLRCSFTRPLWVSGRTYTAAGPIRPAMG